MVFFGGFTGETKVGKGSEQSTADQGAVVVGFVAKGTTNGVGSFVHGGGVLLGGQYGF